MKKKTVKALAVMVLTGVIGFSMTFAGGVTSAAYAASDDMTYEDFEGKNVEKLKKDEDTKALADDPELYRYYKVDKDGDLSEKKVEPDEVDKFIQEMDKNAEGINDKTLTKMSDDMMCVGCGVSGLGKAEIPSKYKKYKRYHAIDISWWQNDISAADWKKVKNAGVTHVIIRTSYTSLSSFTLNKDSKFATNIQRAYDAGMKIGVYHFSQATTVSEAEKEAAYVIDILKDKKSKVSLPVVFDYETNSAGRLNMSKLKKLASDGTSTKICKAFCDKVKAAGYTPMLYANYTTLKNYLDYNTLQKTYRIWLANYTTNGSATTYPGEYWMWQYSSSGKVNGLSGSIDINYIFENGQGGSSTTPETEATSGDESSQETTAPTTKPTDFTVKPVTPYKAKTKCKLNYRTGPGTNYTKKGTFRKGKTVNVVGKSGDWSKLKNGYFVKTKRLTKITSSSSYKVKVTTDLNYRKGPGTNYKVLGTYSKGKVVTITSKKNGWGKTSKGYIFLAYTKKL
ncbi:MAG: GH25 family lysozyme [Bacillota bacterium]|nr:GH25 family lysozyme [Bacillota bacterium]